HRNRHYRPPRGRPRARRRRDHQSARHRRALQSRRDCQMRSVWQAFSLRRAFSPPRVLFTLLVLGVPLSAAEQLRYIIIFSRHGVRAPTWTAERLNQYSAQPWPDWRVPAGTLTAHGRSGMKLLGARYGDYLRGEQLLGSGCTDAEHVHFEADKDPRTVESARALAEGMLPDCKTEVQWSHADGQDPMYYGVGEPDSNMAAAAVLGRIGPNQQALDEAY